MEGGGEGMERGRDGMVAIIRGLQDARLAVTLMNDPGSPRGSVYAPRSPFHPSPQYPLTNSEGTNTRIPVTTDIGAQVRDDRYTSSYQLAHCNQRPSSPPVRLPEFPLRKPDFRRNQGNFEISYERFRSGEIPTSSFRAAGTTTPYRSSFSILDRGTPTYDVRASEAFADSLRKYPLGDRTPSADLISKLITYAQNKNEASATKSPRYVPKERPEREKRRYKDKDIQTYTRTRPKIEVSIEEMKYKPSKRMRMHSPDKDSREKRYKDNQLNETYDYLKSTSPPYYSRAPEVRYLSDMSKCIKETIRQIVDDSRPEVCTQMHNRYLEHRKRCQSRSAHKSGESSQANASQLTVIPFKPTDTCVSTCPYRAPPCYCKKRPPLMKQDSKEEFTRKVTEKIGNWLLDIPTYAKMSAEDHRKRIDKIEDLANKLADLKDDYDIEEKARKEVEKCLEKLPMWLPSNKSERDNFKSLVADNLMNKLKRVFEGTDKFDDEITKWIDDIRFKSRDNFGEIIDKDKIADTFAERIKALVVERPENDDDYHDALKNEILDILHELPIETNGNKDKEIEKLANKLVNNIKSIPASEINQKEEVDKFDKAILKWIDVIDFKRKDSTGNTVDRDEIQSSVIERLKSLALDRPLDDEQYHDALKNEIIDILDGLPIEIQGSKSKVIEKLAAKLANTLKDIPQSEIKPKGDKFDEKISELLKDIKFKKRDSGGLFINTQKFANIFAERLKPLVIDRPDDDDEHHEALKKEVLDILEDLPIEVEGNKRKYLDKVAEKLTKVIKKIPAHEIIQKTETDKFDNKISQWIRDIKFKRRDSQGNKIDKKKIMDTLSKRLKSIAIERPEDDDEYHETLRNEALDILYDLPIEFEGNKDKFVDKLATKLAKSLKDIPASEIKLKSDKFDETISQWIKDIKFKRKDNQGDIIDKEKIAETFKNRLKSIAIERPEDDEEFHELLKNEVLDILEDLPIEIKGNKDKFIDNLASKLAKKLKSIPVSDIKPQTDKFDQNISQWMKDIKLKKRDSQGEIVNKEKVMETFQERLKSIAIDRPEDDDDYHEALKMEILDILEDLPIEFTGNKEKFINSLATKLVKTLKDIPTSEIKPTADKFDQIISQLMKDIKLKKKDSQGEIIDKEMVEEIFRERLKAIAINRPKDNNEYHEALMNEALDILKDLPMEVKGDKSKFIEKIATKFAKSLKNVPPSEIKAKKNKLDQKMKVKKKDDHGEGVMKKRLEDDEKYHEVLKSETSDILRAAPTSDIKHDTVKIEPVRRTSKDIELFNEDIRGWLENIPELSSSSQSEMNKMVESLGKRLKEFNTKNTGDIEGFEDEIKKWLSNESRKRGNRLDSKTLEKFANQLSGNIFNTVQQQKEFPVDTIKGKKAPEVRKGRSGQEYKDDCSKEIQAWLDDIPQFSGTKEEKARMIDSLSKKLHNLRAEGVLDEDEIQDEITDWLINESNKKGIKWDAKTKEDLVTQLAERIGKIQPPKRSSDEIEDEIVTAIWNRLRDIPEIVDSDENIKMVDELAKRISILRKKLGDNVSEDSIRKEVGSWLCEFMEYTGVDPKHKDKLTKDLTYKMKSILKPYSNQNELKQTINNEVSSIIDRNSLELSPQAKKNIGRRVSAFLARNITNVGDDKQNQEEIKSKIVRIIGQETDLSDKKAKELAELFIGSAKRISVIEHRSKLKSDSPEEVRAFISDKVKNALCTLKIDNLEEIKDNLTDLLVDQVLNGGDADFTTEKIMEVLQSTNMSEEDAKDLTMKLAIQAQNFSSIRRDSALSLPNEFTFNEKEMFQTSAIKEITDFMDEVKDDDMDAQAKRKVKTAAQKLAEILCDVISDPNQSITDKEDTINYEVFKFLKRFDVPVEEYGYDLANRLRTIAVTSTPRASFQGDSFYPRRTSFSIGSIYVPDELKKKIEQNFVSDLEEAIEDWILDLPIQIDDKALIDNIARNLASDIADRQKYLQTHPEVKLTEEEELEFLKYQVFRAMGKSVKAEDLATIINHTPALLAVIKDVLIPVLTKPPFMVNEGEIMNKLLDEISIWVEEISSELNEDDIDYEKRQEKVKKLAEKLHKIAQSKEKITEKMDSEISDWLKPFLKEIKHTNVQSMVANLKNRLLLKGILKELTEEPPSVSGDQLQQDTSQFLEENLSTGIMDWLKSLPLYQRRNTSEKQIQENIMQDLANDIKKVIQRAKSDTDLDIEILKEVKKHIDRLPMEPELKTDKAFIDKTSAQLVDYLKNMQMFENVSGRQSTTPVEYLVSTVNDWMKSLPMNTKSLQTREVDDLKMDFITRLSEALKDPNQQDDQAIRDNIKQFLNKLPVDIKKANDPKFIEQKVDLLFKNILATPFLAATKRPTIHRDLVETAVQSWSKNIPLAPGKRPEHVSDKIEHFTSEISSVLEDTNVSAVDNYKNTLHDKTKHFLKNMPVKPENLVPEKLHDLAENFVTTIKNKAADLSPKPIPNKNAADVLYDNITTWCEDLPLYEGSTPEEKERANTLRHNLASKLMNKIGELNMNPEILNDDALYEHLIQEEINDLLSDLPQSPEMQANIESIKENLMSKVKEVKQKTQDEFAGQTYKQQLRDTISKTLPFDAELSSEGPEPFEVLVDNLADAYLNLNFITGSAEQKVAYKKKIADEITRYCNDYLKRHPDAPLDSIKLNQDLFNALKSIPTPKDEIMRFEAEQVRMKDEINDWMKELPLSLDSGPEALQRNKMASVLAKKLLEIEKEKEVNPDMNYEDKAQKEIAKLLKKLPIEPGHEAEIDDMIKHLTHKIQSTEQSRRISESTTRQSIELGPEHYGEPSIKPSSEDLPCTCIRKAKQKPVCIKHICNYKPKIPASTLSTEDRAHLERIRIRNQPCKIHKICSCRDASVSPPPIDAASQTDITPTVPTICTRIPVSPRLSPCMPAPPCAPVPPCSGSEQEVSPQIVIKEYLWDSGTSKLLGPVYRLPCIEVDTSSPSVPSLQRPLQKSVSIQQSPCSVSERPPCSTSRQIPPRPCINLSRPPCTDETATPNPCINLGTSPCPSAHQISTRPCPQPPRPCLINLGSSPCQSPHQMPTSRFERKTPCLTPLRPCVTLGTSPCPSPIQLPPLYNVPRTPCSTRPCSNLGRSPCSSPHQMPAPKPCITLPRPVISSQPPCPEIPYCSTPRRPISRNPNVPFRQPNFQPNSGTYSPRENEEPGRVLRPRVVNVGDEDSMSPCRRRNEDERISEYKDSYRPTIYRVPSRDNIQRQRDDRMRCCRCNHRIRNVCQRHRSPHCPSTENVRHCSKCCGLPCPHPMGLFFR